MYLSESLQKKWEGVLDHPDLPKIEDKYKKSVTVVLEKRHRNGEVWSGPFRGSSNKLCFSR